MGRAVAIGLAAEGAHVVVAEVDRDAAAETVAEIQGAKGRAMRRAIAASCLGLDRLAYSFG